MGKYRIVQTDFWNNPFVLEEMRPEDKYFYLYLLTNPHKTEIGIYKMTKEKMAFDLGYPIETVQVLMERFIHDYKLIRYNPETKELTLKNRGKYNLQKGDNQNEDELEISIAHDHMEIDYTFSSRHTICGQIENNKEKQQKSGKALRLDLQDEVEMEITLQNSQQEADVQEIIEYWNQHGFGLTKVSEKNQLLSWLDDSNFLEPKSMILNALYIAWVKNKPTLNYVIEILQTWKMNRYLV